jgi:hypothetical protein
LAVEWLEDRTLFSASPLESAQPLRFNTFNVAQVAHFLSSPGEVDLYSVSLSAGDTLQAGISARDAGNQAGASFTFTFPGTPTQGASALSSLLRVFDQNGTPLALNDQEAGDPSLSFQAAAAGTYYIGVSSAPNDDYDPTVANDNYDSTGAGGTTGLYTLGVRHISAAPLLPDMTGSSFRTGADMAAAGDTVPVQFTVQNRGGADPGNFQVQVLLAGNNLFDGSSVVLATLQRSDLVAGANGRDFAAPAGFSVTVPAGAAAGPAALGLRIVPDPRVPDAGLDDKSGVHRGVDWEPLTVVTAAPAGTANLSDVDPSLRTESVGTLNSGLSAITYSVTVGAARGAGQVTE